MDSRTMGEERSFAPPADISTFRDLLIFEERVKQNSARLHARRRNYECFLFALCVFIVYMYYCAMINPSKVRLTNEIFAMHYLYIGLLWVSSMTLVLFFVGGVYSDRIAAANRFVPQANRSLRMLNMYLVMNPGKRWWGGSRTIYRHDGTPLNPRGEIVFSARVDSNFRQGYERYRSAYEQKRQEKLQAVARAKRAKVMWPFSLFVHDKGNKMS